MTVDPATGSATFVFDTFIAPYTIYAAALGANDIWSTLPIFIEVCGYEVITPLDPATLELTVANIEDNLANTEIELLSLFVTTGSEMCPITIFEITDGDGSEIIAEDLYMKGYVELNETHLIIKQDIHEIITFSIMA